MLIKIVFVFFILQSISYSLELPYGAPSIEDLVEQWRSPFSRKIKELSENYIAQKSGNKLTFTSEKEEECVYHTIKPGISLAQMQYNYKSTQNTLKEYGRYWNCFGDKELQEIIITRGKDLKPLSFNDFSKGKRNFSLKDGQTSKLFQISNGDGEQIYSVDIKLMSKGLRAIMAINNLRFLVIDQEDDNNYFRVSYTFYPYHLKYSRKYKAWNKHRDFPIMKLSAYQNKAQDGELFYLSPNRKRISLQSFQNYINHFLLDKSKGTIKTIQSMLGYHLNMFPKTSFTSSIVQSEKLLSELQLNNIRLIQGSEINLVQNYIQSLIEHIEKGEIIVDDRRSEE